MKKTWILLLGCLLLLWGCGGSGTSAKVSPDAKGSASVTIHWPQKSRLVPADTGCIEILISGAASPTVTLTNGTDYVASPGNGGTSTVTTVQLAPGSYTVTAKAWPGSTPGGGASPQAVGSTGLVISPGTVTPFSITMASTIDHIEVTANGTTMEVGPSGVISGPASLPLVPTQLNATTITPKNSAGDSLVLFTFSLTGNEVSNSDGKLVVGEVADNNSNSGGSVLTANLVANSDATTGYTSSVSVNYVEGGTTVVTYTVPVTMGAISIGSPTSLSVNGAWSRLDAVSNTSASGYVIGAFDSSLSSEALTEQIGQGPTSALVGGINTTKAVSFLDANDGYFLSTGGVVSAYDQGGTVNNSLNGLTGIRLMANEVTSAGLPFFVDSGGAYLYGTTKVSSTAITDATQIAASLAPSSGYLFWSLNSSNVLNRTTSVGVDFAISGITPSVIAASPSSPLIYTAVASGGTNSLKCLSPAGVAVGTLTLNTSANALTGLSVFVDPTTGKVDGTAISNAGSPVAIQF